MTTFTYNDTVAHTNDATFRSWGLNYSTALATVGMVQTADTGQIDWATVLRPGTNTAAGYQIWRFNDALQATAPVFIKFEFGTGSGANTPCVWITVGTGSDGAGNITGVYMSRRSIFTSTAALPGGSLPCFFCHTAGFLGIGWLPFRSGNGTRAYSTLVMQRTSNASGAPTAFGLDCISSNSNPVASLNQVAARFAATATPNIGGIQLSNTSGTPPPNIANVAVPFADTEPNYTYNRDDSGNLLPDTYHQIFPLWSILQKDFPAIGCFFAVQNDPYFDATTIGTTFQIRIGNFPLRTYLNTGGGQAGPLVGAATELQTFILWE